MTELQRHLPREEMIDSGWMTEEGTANERFTSPEQGAATSTWAAISPMLVGLRVYCEDCDIAQPTAPDGREARVCGVNAHAIDPEAAAGLWSYSATLTGVDAFARPVRRTEQPKPAAGYRLALCRRDRNNRAHELIRRAHP
jgi:hypothetical protein